MKNIILVLVVFLGLLQADTVGVPSKSWVDVPRPSTVTDTMEIGEEYVVPASALTSSTVKAEKVEMFVADNEKYRKMVIDFIDPLWFFIRDYTTLFASFLLFLSGVFYIFFYRPLAKRVSQSDDEDIMVSHAVIRKDKIQTPLTSETSILSQSQYSTLYGLMNETFIYEKEQIILSQSLTQEEQNRAVISLEWKFNQVLHFSLPKLSSNNVIRFKEGVKELLDEEVSRDIMIVALEDILEEGKVSEKDKVAIQKMLALHSKKEIEAVNNHQTQAVNYTSYMGQ